MKRIQLGLFAVSVLFATQVARAQTTEANRAAAVALFDQAQQLMAAGDYAKACPKLAESNRLDPQLGALLHLADCYEKAGRLASAWASWRDAADIALKRGDSREQAARDRASALAPRLSKLKIEVPPASDDPALEVRQNGNLLPRALWSSELPVDAGEQVLEFSAPGKKTLTAKVLIAREGAVEVYTLGALESAAAPAVEAPPPLPTTAPPKAQTAPAPAAPASVAPDRPRGGAQRTLGWVCGGLGIVGLGAGVYFDLQRRSKDSERADICPSGKNCTQQDKTRVDALNDDVKSAGIAEGISFAAGGLLVATGATLLLSAPSSGDARPVTGRWMVAPGLAKGSVAVHASSWW